jgi:glycosyltransferase involved in cell wall biosynthesis
MITRAAIPVDDRIFPANLAALRVRQPEVAQRLEDLALPPGAQIAVGRDGQLVGCTCADDRRVSWLGGSSMPSFSAPALLASYFDKGVNVVLPTIGTGHEPRILAERLPRHCAVFVCEPDWVRLALALRVVDLAELLSAGRMVLVAGDTEQSLTAFLTEHEGYDFPTELYPLPIVRSAEAAALTGALERTGRRIDQIRRGEFECLTAALRQDRPSPGPTPRATILSIDAYGGAVEQAECLRLAMERLGWPNTCRVPDAPQHCSLMARVRALAESRPDLVLLLNGTPGLVRNAIPADRAPVCWFLESPVLPAAGQEGLSACSRLLAASAPVRDQLIARGAMPDSITILETGVDDVVFRPLEDAARSAPAAAPTVVVDGLDLTPKAAGVGLDSHQILWNRLATTVGAAAETYTPAAMDALLRRAEKASGVELTDPRLRDEFRSVAASRLGKTGVARAAIEALLRRWPGLSLWGANWPVHPTVAGAHRGAVPPPAERNGLFNSAIVLVLPYLDAAAVRFALEAIAAGCCPVWPHAGREILPDYPQTSGLLADVPTYRSFREMVDLTRRLLSHPKERARVVDPLRRQLLASHTVAHRLQTIRDSLRPA